MLKLKKKSIKKLTKTIELTWLNRYTRDMSHETEIIIKKNKAQ